MRGEVQRKCSQQSEAMCWARECTQSHMYVVAFAHGPCASTVLWVGVSGKKVALNFNLQSKKHRVSELECYLLSMLCRRPGYYSLGHLSCLLWMVWTKAGAHIVISKTERSGSDFKWSVWECQCVYRKALASFINGYIICMYIYISIITQWLNFHISSNCFLQFVWCVCASVVCGVCMGMWCVCGMCVYRCVCMDVVSV